jgi:Mor family transcriptional regulator
MTELLLHEVAISDLPPVLYLIAELIGLKKTLALINIAGGRTIYLRQDTFFQEKEIQEILSQQDLNLLSKFFSGTISIPRGKSAFTIARNRCIWRDCFFLSRKELIRKYELSERQIINAINSQESRLQELAS